MKRKKRLGKRIIVSTEQVNNYGFRVLTDGIDLTQYEKNPLMLWMHKRAYGETLAIGIVIELSKIDDPELGRVLVGEPVFDEDDDFAMTIYKKYENEVYRMASAGLHPVDWSEDETLILPGQRGYTLVKSKLEEISLCDIGGNDGAITVALYNNSSELIQLSATGENADIPLIKNPLIQTEMSKIELTAAKAAVMLGLKEIGSAEEFETKIMETVQLAANQKTQIETLTREKQEAESKLKENEKIQLAAKNESMVQKAVDERKITADEKPFYLSLAETNPDEVEKLLKAKAGSPTVKTQLSASENSTSEFKDKSWDDLDKSGKLVKLKSSDPNLFADLYKQKFGKEPNT